LKKIFNLKESIYREGEYIIGSAQTGSHACYFLYGILRKGETREISPGKGHEEILVCIEGAIKLESEEHSFVLSKGQAVHLADEESFYIESEAETSIYVVAGGHSDASHHH
jgi:glyoxylate utilization-related uncharacterized protein